jgi:hypothetical protein
MKLDRILPLSICAAIIISFFFLILKNSVNIPNGDDMYCLLLFTQQFQDATGLAERFQLLIQQWVEHRILFSRVSALTSYVLHGGLVNFVSIIFLGNLMLLGFTLLFRKMLLKAGVSMYYLIPIVLTLFSPIMYEGNLWAGASTVYMPVCFMGLLTAYLLANPSRSRFAVAIGVALLATFSFGNGMFAFVAGLLILVLQQQYRRAILWFVIMIGGVAYYFHDFFNASATNAFSFSAHFQHPSYLFYNLFAFLGGILDSTESSNMALQRENMPGLFFGLLLVAITIIGVYDFFFGKTGTIKNPKNGPVSLAWIGMVAFAGLTALSMAYSRTSGESINTLSSRYKIYSMIAFILVYLWCLMAVRRKSLTGWIFGIFSFSLLVFNYYTTYGKLANYKSVLLAGQYNYNKNHNWVIYRHTAYYEGASQAVCDTIKSKANPVFDFIKPFPELDHEALRTANTLSDIQISESKNCQGFAGNCVVVNTDSYPEIGNFVTGIYLVAYNDKNIFLFPGTPKRNGRVNMLTKGDYFKPGFYVDENFGKSLGAGVEYQLAIFCPSAKEKIRLIGRKIKG